MERILKPIKSILLKFINSIKNLVRLQVNSTEVNKTNNKLSGYDYLDILSFWVNKVYPYSHVILLTNINVEAKNIQFWAKVPTYQSPLFLKDIVVLLCKDQTEMMRLIRNIDTNFAEAYGFICGKLVSSNEEVYWGID
jgi:hypothetical protein